MATGKSQLLRGAVFALLLALLAVMALQGPGLGTQAAQAQTGDQNVPKAECGPGDRTETGLQGQTTEAERLSGASRQAYNCNLELIGQYTGDGAKYQMTSYRNCAYYGTQPREGREQPGAVVVDVSDPRNPVATDFLTEPAMLDPHESIKVLESHGLLAGVQAGSSGFAIYDISEDCRFPKLLGSVDLGPGPQGHAGDFAPDGRTYYGTSTNGRSLYAIDISDPRNPEMILNWIPPGGVGAPHDLSVSEDGMRVYVAQRGNNPPFNNGLTILDSSDFQLRRPNPDFSVVGSVYWDDGRNAQMPTQITIKGRPYILFSDESGSRAFDREAACADGVSPFAGARLIDMSDERNPVVVSKIMLEANLAENCEETVDEITSTFGYDAHYCTVDDPRNAKLAACSWFQSGVRVFDIRDPYNPREVAYYKPGAVGDASRPGSTLHTQGERTFDYSSSNIRWSKYRGENHLWFTSHDNGFQVVKFTGDLEHLAPGRYGNPGRSASAPGRAR